MGDTQVENARMIANEIQDRRLRALRDNFSLVGYDETTIATNYEFAAKNGHVKREQVDIATFSDAIRHDLQTSCMAACRITPHTDRVDLADKLSYLAVPVAFLADDNAIEVWKIKPHKRSEFVEQYSYDQIGEFFAAHRRDLRPDAISAAKAKGFQLSFLDVDPGLYAFAYDATNALLSAQFEHAVTQARQEAARLRIETPNLTTVLTRLALQVLAAAILEDKQAFPTPRLERSTTARTLLERAAHHYKDYFDLGDINAFRKADRDDIADALHADLRRNITFRSFTNMMLACFYEDTFVTDELRQKLGIHYTPAPLARRVLSRLPIESLPPESRTILDGTCGSGNLLLAAHERLRALLPARLPADRIHEYLLGRIHGFDKDGFAALVSRLSLFLTGIPASGRWDIRERDFLDVRPEQVDFTPTIIVGNPPFRETREGALSQLASVILDRYLDFLPRDGLLGVILPETFLENSSSRRARNHLFEKCDLLEMWHLPAGIFASSHHTTVVILARKLAERRSLIAHHSSSGATKRPLRVEWVRQQRPARDTFLQDGTPTFSFVALSPTESADVSPSPIDGVLWSKLPSLPILGDVARVRNGIVPGISGRDDLSVKSLSDDWRPWLAYGNSIAPHLIQWEIRALERPARPKRPPTSLSGKQRRPGPPARFVHYPGNLQWPRLDLEKEGVFAAPNVKVLVNANRNPASPWRAYATIDDIGFYPSQGLHCIIPKPGTTLEELAAYLNSPLASLWVAARNQSLWIKEDTYRTMPYPRFTDDDRTRLAALVRDLMALRKAHPDTGKVSASVKADMLARTATIDGIVFDAAGLTPEMRQFIAEYMAPYRRPGLEWTQVAIGVEAEEARAHADGETARAWTVTGEILSVDPTADRVRMWVSGYNDNEPFDAPIPQAMPGWALRPGAMFYADIPWEGRNSDTFPALQTRNYRSLDFTYLPVSELAPSTVDPTSLESRYQPTDATRY